MATVLSHHKYPNDWLSGSVRINVPSASEAVDQYVFKAFRDTIIDKVVVRYATAGSDSGTVTVGVQHVHDTDAIGGASTSEASTSEGVQYAVDVLSSDIDLSATANTEYEGTINTSNNLVKANRWVALNFTGTMTAIAGLSIEILYRTTPGFDASLGGGDTGGGLPNIQGSLD